MEGRRTRGRPKRLEEAGKSTLIAENVSTTSTNVNVANKRAASKAKVSPPRNLSPGRTRRSSRTRTSNVTAAPSTTTILIRKSSPTPNPSPIKEINESPSPKTTLSKTRIPTALGSNVTATGKSSPRFTNKSTSSVHSTYSSSSTQKTIEIRSTTSALDTEFQKLSDYIRRSVSKAIDSGRREGTHTPTTNTEIESRYSRSMSRSIYDDGASSKAEFSDNETNGQMVEDEDEEDDDEHYSSFNLTAQHSYSTSALGKNCRQLEIPREFGGWPGTTLLMILVPCLVYYLQWSCQKNICKLNLPNLVVSGLKNSATWKSIFSNEAVSAFITFQISVFVLSAFLCGRYVRLPSERFGTFLQHGVEYKFNAAPVAIIMTLAAGYAEYLNYPVTDFVLQHQLNFCLYGFINAFVLALWSYIRADMLRNKTNVAQLNIYAKTGNLLIDYAQGKQLNPKWLDFVYLKLVFYRVSLLLTLLYGECYLYKQLPTLSQSASEHASVWTIAANYFQNFHYNSAALLTSGMLLVYVLDAIIFEHHLASSFELQGEGFGALLLIRYAATPYLLTSVARYFYEQQFERPVEVSTPLTCCFAAYVPLFLLITGLILKRISNAVKYKYRINPTNQYFEGIETIHTFQGRRLLLGSLWGRLRQPNYAGDLIALAALAMPVFVRFAWPPFICILLLCINLLHRIGRVQTRNMSRYHSSWVRYCNRVRYYICPKVF